MSFRQILVLSCSILLVPVQAFGGKLDVAVGKADREIKLLAEFDKLQPHQPGNFGDMAIAQPAGWAGGPRIELASAPSETESFLRYNLRRLDVPWNADYDLQTFIAQSSSIKWDIGIAYGLTALIGFNDNDWGWGTKSFHFENEGWFGKDTKYLGVDKLGHAYTGYLLSEYFTQRIAHSTEDRAGAALTGAVLGMGIQTYVEVLDGFSDNGFSPQDLIADGIGVGLSALRSSVPGLADKFDFRMEYLPSGNDGAFRPYHDYTGQKYVLALQLAGFEKLEDTPMRFVELQAGYYAKGFTEKEQADGEEIRREPYLAIGFNLQELLDMAPAHDSTPALASRRALDYIQVPYTYIATSQN